MAVGMIQLRTIRGVHSNLTFANVEIWICPRGIKAELRIARYPSRADGAVKVGTYNNAVTLADFVDDVTVAYREFAGLGVVRAA